MTSLETCIKEAVEKGGWKPVGFDFDEMQQAFDGFWFKKLPKGRKKESSEILVLFEEIFLDPLFWQALGRARRWQGKHDPLTDTLVRRAHMHAFMTHLDEGKDAESFFAAL